MSTNNINITGGNNQNIIGDNATGTQTINQSGAEFDLNKFFDLMRSAIPDRNRDIVQNEVIAPIEDAVKGYRRGAESNTEDIKTRIMHALDKLKPYAPYLRSTLVAFSEGALKTVPPPVSWIVGGCLEVIRKEKGE